VESVKFQVRTFAFSRLTLSYERRFGTCVCFTKTENNADISTTEVTETTEKAVCRVPVRAYLRGAGHESRTTAWEPLINADERRFGQESPRHTSENTQFTIFSVTFVPLW